MDKKMKVLIIEDLPSDAELAQIELNKTLKNPQFQVVDNEKDYISAINSFKPNLIVSDYAMPSFSGLEALKIQKDIAPDIPFVLLTGSMNEEIAVDAMKAGADDYVIKEHIKRLGPAVLSAIDNKKTQIENKQKEQIQNVIYNISHSVNKSDNLKTVIKEIQSEIGKIIDTTNFYIALYNDKTDMFMLPYFVDEGDEMDEFPAGKSLTNYVRKTKKSLLVNEAKMKDLIKTGDIELFGTDSKVWFGVPLISNQKAIGVLAVQSYTNEFAFNEDDQKTLEFVSDQISIVIARKQANEELRTSEENMRTLLENSPNIIIRIEPDGIINYINDECYNQKPSDLLGKSIYQFIPKNYKERAQKSIDKVFETGENNSFESMDMNNNNNVRWNLNNIAPVMSDGKVVSGIIIIIDITEQKQTEIMQNEFISSASHELRTPLTIMRESLSLLSDNYIGELNSQQLDIVNPCIENIDRLSRILNNLLDTNKMMVHDLKLERNIYDIIPIIENVLMSFEKQIKKKNLELLFKPKEKTLELFIDPDRIIQIFMNLIGNAIKYTDKGKIEISINEEANRVEFCVSDTGRGIDSDSIGTVFDKFHQVSKIMRTGEKFVSTGLSTAKGLVKLHDGRIWVNSEIDKGSKFYFTLPK